MEKYTKRGTKKMTKTRTQYIYSDEFRNRNEHFLHAIADDYGYRLLTAKKDKKGNELEVKNEIDGKDVYLNLHDPLYQKMDNTEKMIAMRGIVAHQGFHAKYTDFTVVKKIEEKYEKESFEYNLQRNYLGMVEDYAVELAGVFRYPGIKKFIQFINQKTFEMTPEIETVELMLGELYAHQVATWQYITAGKIKGKFASKELENLFNETKIIIDEARYDRTTEQRYESTQKIFQLIEPLIQKAKDLNQMEMFSNPKGDDVKEEGFGKGKATDENAIKDLMEKLGKQGQIKEAKDSEEREYQQNKGEATESADGMEGAEGELTQEQLDRLKSSMMTEMTTSTKSEKSEEKQEENHDKIIEEIKEHLEQVKYTSRHEGIEARGNYQFHKNKSKYEKYRKQVHPFTRTMIKKLKDILRFNQDEKRTGQVGGFLTQSQLWRKDGKVFTEKRDKNDEAELAVLLVVDESGSMENYERDIEARRASIALAEVCQALNIPFATVGFTADFHGNTAIHNHYVLFEKGLKEQKSQLANIQHKEDNRDGMSIQYAGEYLLKQPQKDKIMIVISDGLPAHGYDDYGGVEATDDVKMIVKNLEKRGMTIIGVAIGDESEYHHDMYKSAITINDLSQLPKKLMKIIQKNIIKNNTR